MRSRKTLSLSALTLILVAACGGGSPATTGPNGTPNGTPTRNATPAAVATQGTAATAAPLATQGTAATPAPVGNATDMCSLLTPEELSAATGETYVAGTLEPTTGECDWNIEGETTNTGSLVILYDQAADLATIKSAFGSGGSDDTIAGHAAFWNPSSGLQSMWVDIGGGHVLVLSFPRSSELDPSFKATAEGLATKAVGRL